MFIHKMAITTCATGFLVTDETDPEESYPLGAFGDGQLLNALSFVRDNIEHEMEEHAKELAVIAAKHAGENVVPGPGWKPPPDWGGNVPADPPAPAVGTITRPIKTDREIVDEVNALAFTVLLQHGFSAPKGEFLFWRAEKSDVRAWRAWQQAVDLYEQITGSEVSDALQAVLEDEKEEAITEEFPTSRPVA